MVAQVEEILTIHQCWVEDLNKSPTPGSKIRSLKPLQKLAFDLFNGILKLDIYTWQTLYSHVPFKGHFMPLYPDAEFKEFKADLAMLSKFIKRSKNAIENLSPHKKRGSKEDRALRMTMGLLCGIFLKYYKQTNKKIFKKPLGNFIALALDATNITHPDLEEKPTRFWKLLKGSKEFPFQ